ncbi:cyclin-dependent kinase inhibitor 1 isoform X2 [Antennarius striatus]
MMSTHQAVLCSVGNGQARRSLFGPVDREQLQQDYQAALQKDLEEASHRWGFDFKSDRPLECSDFQWEGVSSTKVPLLYRSCMSDLGQRQSQQSQRGAEAAVTPKGGEGEVAPRREKENIPCSPQKCGFNMESLEKTPRRGERTGLKRKQTNITDFYQAKRRVVGMPRKSGE